MGTIGVILENQRVAWFSSGFLADVHPSLGSYEAGSQTMTFLGERYRVLPTPGWAWQRRRWLVANGFLYAEREP